MSLNKIAGVVLVIISCSAYAFADSWITVGTGDLGGGEGSGDTTTPAAITDLAASTGTQEGEVILSWTAVGDDGNTGTASSYIVKYSTLEINTDEKFDAASTYSQSWAPLPAGSQESKTLNGLSSGKILYFAIKAQDEVPNTGALSNSPSAEVKGYTIIITSITPSTAYPGQTLIISGEGFGSLGTVIFSNDLSTIEAIEEYFRTGTIEASLIPVIQSKIVQGIVTSWQDKSIITSPPSSSTLEAGTLYVLVFSLTNKWAHSSLTLDKSRITLDDFEGGSVGTWNTQAPKTGYYAFGTGIVPDNNNITSQGPTSEAKYEGERGMKVKYSYVTDSWGGGWGATLANTFDLSAMNRLKLYLKGDGSSNSVKLKLRATQEAQEKILASPTINLSSTSWKEIVLKMSDFATEDTNGNQTSPTVEAELWKKIIGYNFVYTTQSTSNNYHYVDSIQAYSEEAITPDKPELVVIPTELAFIGYVNGSATSPGKQTLTIYNGQTGTGSFNFTASATPEWINLSSNSGVAYDTPAVSIEVSINLNTMPTIEGTYDGTITVSATDSNVQGTPDKINVTLEIKKITGPTIIELSHSLAPAGARITLKGLEFGETQGTSQILFTRNGAAHPAKVISWTSTEVMVEVPPTLSEGTYNLEIYRLTIAAEGIDVAQRSNVVTFQVTAAQTAGVALIYPNPFDPVKGQTTTIQFNPEGVNNIGVYIYDLTARLIKREIVNGNNQYVWNGKDSFGNLAGDGVYLVRVINEDTRVLIAKGKILVIKR